MKVRGFHFANASDSDQPRVGFTVINVGPSDATIERAGWDEATVEIAPVIPSGKLHEVRSEPNNLFRTEIET